MAAIQNPLRCSAAQLEALARLEREIRATDPSNRSKYVREFTEAYPSYHSVLKPHEWRAQVLDSHIVLVGDYHALEASQRFCETTLTQLSTAGRKVVFGMEMVFARDQHLLDAWLERRISDEQLREGMRFDRDWGFDWRPFRRLLETARASCEHIYGLDSGNRDDIRKISRRDRHAASRIAKLRRRHPDAAVVVLFGESHLAPGHLPRHLRPLVGGDRMLAILQNHDALYWRIVGERRRSVEAVRVTEDVICVFNATPLEKYESYRMYLERWTE